MVKAFHLHKVLFYLFIYVLISDNFVFGLTYVTVWMCEGRARHLPFTVIRRQVYEFLRPAVHFTRLYRCDDEEILPGCYNRIMFCCFL